MPLAIMPAQSNVPQANAVSSVSSSASLGPLPGSLSRRAISMRELRSSRRVSAESQQAANDDISPPILRTLQSSLDNVAMVRSERTQAQAQPQLDPFESGALPGWWHDLARTTGTVRLMVLEWREELCPHCGAMLLKGELTTWCCDRGRKMLPRLPELPAYFTNYVNSRANQTSSNSRKVNNLFAFSSIGVDGQFKILPAPSNVAITGRVYHKLWDINQGQHSLRWFLYDSLEREREAKRISVPAPFVDVVRRLMDDVSPYVRWLRHAASTIPAPNAPLTIELQSTTVGAGELAAVIHVVNIQELQPRSILIHRNGSSTSQKVSILSSHYEPLQYPLLFPYGTPGWCPPSTNEHSFSQINWYRFRLLTEPRFLWFGRLTNEYLVDMYSRVEEERLNYIRSGRSDQMDEAMQRRDDIFLVDPDAQAVELGSALTLLSSFIGSRAWASEQVADALALCREHGKPSLFITITTNPNWPEITSQLRPGQSASDIPFIVARVFHLRVKKCLEYIKRSFGSLVYLVKVIEFQKRGLPHVHMVLKV